MKGETVRALVRAPASASTRGLSSAASASASTRGLSGAASANAPTRGLSGAASANAPTRGLSSAASASGRGMSTAASASTRSLSTARSVLRVLALLVERPAGVRADEVAEALGKSTSTAYYLLTSLCDEGFAVHESKGLYRPARGLEELTAVAEESGHLGDGLSGTVDELFLRTRKRSYLGVVRAGRIEITTFRGRQGVPRIPGLGNEIRDSAHALAMGKVVLALLDSNGVSRYVARGLSAFTSQTITSPQELVAELQRVSADGFAVDREEFDSNFCCIAAPIFDQRGRFAAVLGLSVTASVFDAECERLAEIVVDVARGATAAASSSPRLGGGGGAAPAADRASASHAGRSRIRTVSRVAS